MQPTDTQLLPIVLESNKRVTVAFVVVGTLFAAMMATTACLTIPALPRWPSVPLLIFSATFAVVFGWGSYRLIHFVKHPNTLVLDRNGVAVTIGRRTEFVRWRDIAAVGHTSDVSIFMPQNTVLSLKPDAILKRLQNKVPRLGTETFVDLGNSWKTDRFYNSGQIAALIEQCRKELG
jgi:hypothetical protein